MRRERFVPHDYQVKAMEWILSHPRCLLFLEMGLGKTVATLSAIQRLCDYGELEKVLVIAPKKVAESTWSQEALKWDHLNLRVSVILGTAAECRAAMERDAEVYVTSRDRVVWLMRELKGRLPYDMVVIDELTSFKNHSSKRFKALKAAFLDPRTRMRGIRVVGLTGTPTPNGYLDLWAQVYCVDLGERLGQFFTKYRSRWFDTWERNNIVYKAWPKKGAVDEIRGLIADIALTMRAEDWLSMPELIEHDVPVALSPAKMRAYRKFEKECVLEMKDAEITAQSAAALLNKLSQFANGAVYDEERNVVEIHDEKLAALEEILEGTESPVLCFYAYRHDATRIMKRFAGLHPRMYEGDRELQDWNEGRIRLLLAHPASTAFGLNMQRGGHTAVWFSTGWNLELYQQANARLHRQGQEQRVIVHRLIARGTVDERMTGAITQKGKAQASLVKQLARAVVAEAGSERMGAVAQSASTGSSRAMFLHRRVSHSCQERGQNPQRPTKESNTIYPQF